MDKLEPYIAKLERDNAIYKRDMKIIESEVIAIHNSILLGEPHDVFRLERLRYLIKLLKRR